MSWKAGSIRLVQFSSVQSLDRSGCRRDMRDVPAEVLSQSFLQQSIVSSSGMDRNVHCLMLSVQHFLCRPLRCLRSTVPLRMLLESLSVVDVLTKGVRTARSRSTSIRDVQNASFMGIQITWSGVYNTPVSVMCKIPC